MKRIMNFLSCLCVLVFSLGAPAAEKETPLPKDLPPYGPTVPFRAPNVEIKKLPNGLTLWLVPRSGYPKVALALAVRGGMASDPANLPGLSDLLTATIDQGTKTRNARQIAEEIQAAGGDLNTDSRADILLLSTAVLASKVDGALAVIADVVENATLPASEVALAKRNAADNLRAQEADPDFLAGRALAKQVFGSHPYSITSPTQASIAAAQPAVIRAEFARRFRPDQTLLVAVGDFDAADFIAAVEKSFGGWRAPKAPAVPAVPKPSGKNPRAIFMVERPDSVQTTFAIAAFGPLQGTPDYPATEVANAIYGGMFGSRLIRNIREDKGYTYSPYAFLQTRNRADVMQTRADVRNAVTGASLNEVEYELNRMATTAPSDNEVAQARRYLVGLSAIRLQVQASVARQLATLWSYGLPPEELGAESEKIQKVTAQEVEAAGQKYFPASQRTIVAVGEEKVIREQLAPFGIPIRTASR
jgi:zinc protease